MGEFTTLAFRDSLVITSAIAGSAAIALFLTNPFGLLSYFLSAGFGLGAITCFGWACFLGRLQRQKTSC